MFIHSRSSRGNAIRFQTKNGAKTLPDLAAHTHMAYLREYPPGANICSQAFYAGVDTGSSTSLQPEITIALHES